MRWTKEKIDYIREHYPYEPTSEVASFLGITVKHLTKLANRFGIYKTKEAKIKANSTIFKKGSIPHNKGVPQREWCSEDGIRRSSKTRYHKGNIPHTSLPLGSEIPRPDTGYIQVKVSNDAPTARKRWKLKHRLVWEAHHGKIPDGHIVRFKDGNIRNFDLSNLELVSIEENCLRNFGGSHEIQSLRGLMGALAKQIKNTSVKK